MPLGTEVDLGPGHTVLDGHTALPRKGAQHGPRFSADVYCGQTAWWMRIPLGTEVGLGPSNNVLDGDPASITKRDTAASPIFGPCLLRPNGLASQQLLSSCDEFVRNNIFHTSDHCST